MKLFKLTKSTHSLNMGRHLRIPNTLSIYGYRRYTLKQTYENKRVVLYMGFDESFNKLNPVNLCKGLLYETN